MKDRRKEWTCYKLLHAGEGPRGRELLVMMSHYAEAREAAELAAVEFEESEMRDQAYGYTEADGSEYWIEVEDCEGHPFGKWRVVIEVHLKATARAEK